MVKPDPDEDDEDDAEDDVVFLQVCSSMSVYPCANIVPRIGTTLYDPETPSGRASCEEDQNRREAGDVSHHRPVLN